jgi:D-arginine dehydrogenase
VRSWSTDACYKPPVSELPTTTDVAIVGAGFAGVATAWALARRGVDAVVVEREDAPGRFASGRSAGLGRQLAEDDATSRLTIRGAEVLRAELAAVWHPCGGILSFDDRAAADVYEARAARLGVAVEQMDRAAVTARWPGLGALPIAAALHVPSDGVIDVGALLAIFARDLAIVCGVRVALVEPSARGVRLVTARGALEARLVVDAAGAWAGELTGEPPYLWHLGADEVYVRADGAGILVSPCDASATAAADQQPDASGEAALQARLAATAWSGAPIARRWACQRAFTPDRTMRLGRDPARPWLVWAAGLGGHGATASAAVGEVVADACLAALR